MKFTILIQPRPQARTRSSGMVTQKGRVIVRAYDTKDTMLENEQLWAMLLPHKPPQPLQGALRLTIDCYLRVPTGFSKKKALAALSGELRPTTKPDVDNLAKKMKDRMNRIFYLDDKQVVTLLVRKFYGDPPRWEVELTQL